MPGLRGELDVDDEPIPHVAPENQFVALLEGLARTDYTAWSVLMD